MTDVAMERRWRARFGPEAGREMGVSERTRIEVLEAENARLRMALQAVVDEYPVASGTSRSADPDLQGYGSILAAQMALASPQRKGDGS